MLNLYIDSSIARVKNILHKIVGDFPPTVVTGCLVDSSWPLPNKNKNCYREVPRADIEI